MDELDKALLELEEKETINKVNKDFKGYLNRNQVVLPVMYKAPKIKKVLDK